MPRCQDDEISGGDVDRMTSGDTSQGDSLHLIVMEAHRAINVLHADIGALDAAAALITAHGARTSHAAVVARQLGKVCLVGCSSLSIDASERSCRFGDVTIQEGDELSIDGTTGSIYRGALDIRRQKPEALIDEVHHWRRIVAS